MAHGIRQGSTNWYRQTRAGGIQPMVARPIVEPPCFVHVLVVVVVVSPRVEVLAFGAAVFDEQHPPPSWSSCFDLGARGCDRFSLPRGAIDRRARLAHDRFTDDGGVGLIHHSLSWNAISFAFPSGTIPYTLVVLCRSSSYPHVVCVEHPRE